MEQQQQQDKDKKYRISNPQTGETREVTLQEWTQQKLGERGFRKPDDMPDSAP